MDTNYMDVLNRAMEEAKDFVENPSRLDALLIQLEDTLKEVPAVGETLAEVPLMIGLVKSWIKKEYEVSTKVLLTIVGAFVYLVKKKDLVSDKIPIIGMADDLAVLALALNFVKPDLEAYKIWRDSRR